MNQLCSKGVTPENNSAVLFWKAVGPSSIEKEYREKYFQMLGIPPLPDKGDYFVDLDRYLARQKDGAKPGGAKPEPRTKQSAYDLLNPALKRPWPKEKFPVLAAWLAANEKPLAPVGRSIHAALGVTTQWCAERRRRYLPFFSQPFRSLAMRAMLAAARR